MQYYHKFSKEEKVEATKVKQIYVKGTLKLGLLFPKFVEIL